MRKTILRLRLVFLIISLSFLFISCPSPSSPTFATVQFDPLGGSIEVSSIEVFFQTPYGALPIPHKENATFAGWYTKPFGDGEKITETTKMEIFKNHTLYAKWTVQVTFDSQGGEPVSSKMVTVGKPYETLDDAEHANRTFKGWYSDKEGELLIESTSIVTKTQNHTLYAQWVTKVSFDPQGGNSLSYSSKIIEDDQYGDLPTVEREGHTFLGWYTEQENGQKIEEGDTVVAIADHALYAQWEALTYTISFEGQFEGIDLPQTMTRLFGTEYGELPELSHSTATFAGWYTEPFGDGEKITETSLIAKAEDHTLYAKWTVQVTFDSQGGDFVASKRVTVGKPYGDKVIVEREGHTFLGWYTEQENGQKIEEGDTVVAIADHTLYAQWEALTYTISFEGQFEGIDLPQTMTRLFGTEYGELPELSHSTATFAGWYTEPFGDGEMITETSLIAKAEDHTLYAKWTVQVAFDSQGEEPVAPANFVVGGTYDSIPMLEKEGFDFEGWLLNDIGIVPSSPVEMAANHELVATWAYKIGTTGPAGGIVFYRKNDYSDGWRYLEAAPAGWSGSEDDPQYKFGFYRPSGANATVGTQDAIGTGSTNTANLVTWMTDNVYESYRSGIFTRYRNISDYAAKICAEYSIEINGEYYDDWYLPSIEELHQMYIQRTLIGGFNTDYDLWPPYTSAYWSSSERNNGNGKVKTFYDGNTNDFYSRDFAARVRPVRSF